MDQVVDLRHSFKGDRDRTGKHSKSKSLLGSEVRDIQIPKSNATIRVELFKVKAKSDFKFIERLSLEKSLDCSQPTHPLQRMLFNKYLGLSCECQRDITIRVKGQSWFLCRRCLFSSDTDIQAVEEECNLNEPDKSMVPEVALLSSLKFMSSKKVIYHVYSTSTYLTCVACDVFDYFPKSNKIMFKSTKRTQ